jgi:hypothetical protein
MQIFNMTDDHLLNLLKLINFMHQVQWVFVTVLGYYVFLLYIPTVKLETVFERFMPKILSDILIKSVKAFKKSGVIIIILLYILLLLSMYLGDLNLDTIMQNYEWLCQYHINLKK